MPLKKNEPVVIVPYDHAWPAAFAALRAVLAAKIGGLAPDISHLGSTAVPGLAAKPIIDLVVVIEHYDRLERVAGLLAELGYAPEGEKGIAGRHAFKRADERVPYHEGRAWPDHHLYVCAPDNPEYRRQTLFRDWLRGHPAARDEYAALKRELAARFNADREGYTNGKTEFVESILARARAAGAAGTK